MVVKGLRSIAKTLTYCADMLPETTIGNVQQSMFSAKDRTVHKATFAIGVVASDLRLMRQNFDRKLDMLCDFRSCL
jgi:hypothetical protein